MLSEEYNTHTHTHTLRDMHTCYRNRLALVRVSIAMRRHYENYDSYEGKHLIGADLQFRGLVRYHHGGWHAGRHAAEEGGENFTS